MSDLVMIKRVLAFLLFCVLTVAGVPAVDGAALCVQLAPACCCSGVEEPSDESVVSGLTLGKDTRDVQINGAADVVSSNCGKADSSDAVLASTGSAEALGHESCCCEPALPAIPLGAAVNATVVPIELALLQPRVVGAHEFPLHQNLIIGVEAQSRRPLHLATNKVYLLKRSLLI